jgi:hypothetical protein
MRLGGCVRRVEKPCSAAFRGVSFAQPSGTVLKGGEV